MQTFQNHRKGAKGAKKKKRKEELLKTIELGFMPLLLLFLSASFAFFAPLR
ncbi:MAG: hypothetical protein R2873_18430 [Caldilineaceae bacterium]